LLDESLPSESDAFADALKPLLKDDRKFALEICPKLLFSAGDVVQLLIKSNVAHYLEFKAMETVFILENENLEKVPGSKEDVFKSESISLIDKRRLMRFLTSANVESISEGDALLYLMTDASSDSAKADLGDAADWLLSQSEADKTRPLLELCFQHSYRTDSAVERNVVVTPGAESEGSVGLETLVQQAEQLFAGLCPTSEFFPAATPTASADDGQEAMREESDGAGNVSGAAVLVISTSGGHQRRANGGLTATARTLAPVAPALLSCHDDRDLAALARLAHAAHAADAPARVVLLSDAEELFPAARRLASLKSVAAAQTLLESLKLHSGESLSLLVVAFCNRIESLHPDLLDYASVAQLGTHDTVTVIRQWIREDLRGLIAEEFALKVDGAIGRPSPLVVAANFDDVPPPIPDGSRVTDWSFHK
ncbi:hypothetical protein HK405_006860, partial [Cladochytrium tenue]